MGQAWKELKQLAAELDLYVTHETKVNDLSKKIPKDKDYNDVFPKKSTVIYYSKEEITQRTKKCNSVSTNSSLKKIC